MTNLVELVSNLTLDEYIWNDCNDRAIEIGDTFAGRYILFEGHEFCGITPDVEKAIAFLMAE